jgi:DNA-binding response OmpR family regulator
MAQGMSGREHEAPMGDAEKAQIERKHVFCVNGAAEFLDLLRELFQDARFNVTTTNFVEGTHRQIAALKPDIVIVDLVVGIRSGWDLLERLQHEVATHGIPIIVTSTAQQLLDQAQEDPERYGTNRYLVKPFDIDAMLGLVHELIGTA